MQADQFLPDKVKALFAAERRHGLFDFRIDGWSAWRVVRNAVHASVSNLPLAVAGPRTAVRIARALWHTLMLLRILVFTGRRHFVVKTYRSALRVQQGDSFRDVYFDGFLMREPSSVKLEVVNSEAFAAQARHAMRPADLDASVFTFWGRVLAILRPRAEAAEFCRRCSQILREDVDVEISSELLLRQVSSTYWQVRLYRLLLARLAPHAAMVADTGDYALRIACARTGVRFIELQHGVFDSAHPDAVPEWVVGSDEELLLPDVLACYGRFWVEQLAGTRLSRRAQVVGNELIDSARERPHEPPRPNEVRLLLTSQGVDSTRLVSWLEAMMAAAPPELDWRLTIKLHPAYDEHFHGFARLAGARVRIVPGSSMPNVWELLAATDVHMSISSASHFDAAALGVPSIVVPLASHERLLHAVDGVSLLLASEPSDVWTLARAARPLDRHICERFATSHFVDNLLRLVDRPLAQAQSPRRHA